MNLGNLIISEAWIGVYLKILSLSRWCCGCILVYYTRGGRFEPFYCNDKDFYRSQRSWSKVMFLQASVILLTGGGSASVHAWIPPREEVPPMDQAHTPWEETPPPGRRHPSGGDTPQRRPPLHRACWEIRSTHGRYASYWNAILLSLNSVKHL